MSTMDLITVCSGFSEIAQIRADQSQTRLSERENKATKSIGGAIPGIRKKDAVLLRCFNHILMFPEAPTSCFQLTSFLVETNNICEVLSSSTKRLPK